MHRILPVVGLAFLLLPLVSNANTVILTDDFEAGFGNWFNATTGDNNNWGRDYGGTPSYGTGPATGANGSNYYMYLETSYGSAYYAGDTAILQSPLISETGIRLAFQYHMYGADMGTLSVDVLSDSNWIYDVWSVTGQQQISNSAPWPSVEVDLTGYSVSQIRFRATAVGGYRGDMAIDNIEILSMPTGPVAPVFDNDPLVKPTARPGEKYSDSLAGNASDGNNDLLIFSKISGPAWLNIAANGTLSGTPAGTDLASIST
jgi:hypothetical protein